MQTRRLGRSDIDVSVICLGTMTWGEQNSEADGHAQMDYALDHGVNFFDTAEMYAVPPRPETQGRTEEIIGSWFAARGTRDRVILASKVMGRSDSDWLRKNRAKGEVNRAQIFEAVDASLRRLQTDYIDLYQIHWPDRSVSQFGANPVIFKPAEGPENPIEEQLDALSDLMREGKIRQIGLSNESSWGVMTFLHASGQRNQPRVQSLQNAYSLLNRTFETNLAEIAMREQVGLLAYSPLAQGFLTGKYQNGAQPAGARRTLFNRQQRYETPGAAPAIDKYVAFAKEIGADPAQLALQFVTTRPFVTATIIGATNMDQLAANIGSIGLSWSAEIERRLNDIHLIHTNPCP